ncbi:hypothetical protein GCM10010357_11330 [Streptomyces luteireticuli]|uniref:Uncharacterized protein n=1 Tax=Streptomyces luteireticuli TaxID=173858 RepID=A0ABP3I9C4_9ACTN
MMGAAAHALVALIGAVCVGSYVLAGELAVLVVVLASVGGLTWRVAAASRPRPLRWGRHGRPVSEMSGVSGVSGVRIRHQGDAHVVHDEGRQRQ